MSDKYQNQENKSDAFPVNDSLFKQNPLPMTVREKLIALRVQLRAVAAINDKTDNFKNTVSDIDVNLSLFESGLAGYLKNAKTGRPIGSVKDEVEEIFESNGAFCKNVPKDYFDRNKGKIDFELDAMSTYQLKCYNQNGESYVVIVDITNFIKDLEKECVYAQHPKIAKTERIQSYIPDALLNKVASTGSAVLPKSKLKDKLESIAGSQAMELFQSEKINLDFENNVKNDAKKLLSAEIDKLIQSKPQDQKKVATQMKVQILKDFDRVSGVGRNFNTNRFIDQFPELPRLLHKSFEVSFEKNCAKSEERVLGSIGSLDSAGSKQVICDDETYKKQYKKQFEIMKKEGFSLENGVNNFKEQSSLRLKFNNDLMTEAKHQGATIIDKPKSTIERPLSPSINVTSQSTDITERLRDAIARRQSPLPGISTAQEAESIERPLSTPVNSTSQSKNTKMNNR